MGKEEALSDQQKAVQVALLQTGLGGALDVIFNRDDGLYLSLVEHFQRLGLLCGLDPRLAERARQMLEVVLAALDVDAKLLNINIEGASKALGLKRELT